MFPAMLKTELQKSLRYTFCPAYGTAVGYKLGLQCLSILLIFEKVLKKHNQKSKAFHFT